MDGPKVSGEEVTAHGWGGMATGEGGYQLHAGVPCHGIVETVDLFPTLMELCELKSPTNLDGISLLPQLSDPNKPTSKPAYSFWTSARAQP